MHTSDPNRKSLFPNGIYYHQVSILLTNQRKITLNGVQKVTPEGVLLTALGPFGITVLEGTYQNASHKSQVTLYRSELEKHRKTIENYFELLCEIYRLPFRNGQLWQIKELQSGLQWKGLKSIHYDSNQMVDEMEMKDNDIVVQVKVTHYDLH